MNSKTYIALEWLFKSIAMLNSLVFFLFFGVVGAIFHMDPAGGEITRSGEKLYAYFLFVFGILYLIPNNIIRKSNLLIISYAILILSPLLLLIADNVFYNLFSGHILFIQMIKGYMMIPLVISLTTLLSLLFSLLGERKKFEESKY